MILSNIPEPPVQFDEEDPVYFASLHVRKQLLHDRTLESGLSGAVAFVPVDLYDFVAVIHGILSQDLLLRLQTVTVKELLFRGYTGIQRHTQHI